MKEPDCLIFDIITAKIAAVPSVPFNILMNVSKERSHSSYDTDHRPKTIAVDLKEHAHADKPQTKCPNTQDLKVRFELDNSSTFQVFIEPVCQKDDPQILLERRDLQNPGLDIRNPRRKGQSLEQVSRSPC